MLFVIPSVRDALEAYPSKLFEYKYILIYNLKVTRIILLGSGGCGEPTE